MLVVIINVIGSAFGPVIGGVVSDLLADRFGAESLRVSLFSLSVLTIFGGLLFGRASVHYPHDLTRVGRMDEGASPLGQGKLKESTL